MMGNKFVIAFFKLRWATLKAALVERRSKLGESKTIQQFSRDAEDIEAWVSEKLQTVLDESYKDPTNLQVWARQFHLERLSLDLKNAITGYGTGSSIIESLKEKFPWLARKTSKFRSALTFPSFSNFSQSSKSTKLLKLKFPPTKKEFWKPSI